MLSGIWQRVVARYKSYKFAMNIIVCFPNVCNISLELLFEYCLILPIPNGAFGACRLELRMSLSFGAANELVVWSSE
ncbi:unnamed protein product [Toxocara canis]|uniref:Ovule protein n=1 Tax=Toxocara canis TaxID=6265 RepID=A0A183UTJ6_TOXCA|nr:unnamed protein product [Toxocara canis]